MLLNRFLRWWGIELSNISHASTQGLKLAPFIRAPISEQHCLKTHLGYMQRVHQLSLSSHKVSFLWNKRVCWSGNCRKDGPIR